MRREIRHPGPARIALDRALMREVNETIRGLVEDVPTAEFLCECGQAECIETIELTLDEYDDLRASPSRFVVRPGHPIAGGDLVVAETRRYVIVERLDKPRS